MPSAWRFEPYPRLPTQPLYTRAAPRFMATSAMFLFCFDIRASVVELEVRQLEAVALPELAFLAASVARAPMAAACLSVFPVPESRALRWPTHGPSLNSQHRPSLPNSTS